MNVSSPNHEMYAIFTTNQSRLKIGKTSETVMTIDPAGLTSLPFEVMINAANRMELEALYQAWIGNPSKKARSKPFLAESLILYASLVKIDHQQQRDDSTSIMGYRVQGPVYSSAWRNNVLADAIIVIKRWSSGKSADAVAQSFSKNAEARRTQFTTRFVPAWKTPSFDTLALVSHQLSHNRLGHFINAIESKLRTLSTTGTTVLMFDGMDNLTVEVDFLRVLRARWPSMQFILAVNETFRRLRYTAGSNELSADQDLRVRIAYGWDLMDRSIFCAIFYLDVLLAQSLLASDQRDPHYRHLLDWWEYLRRNRQQGKAVYEGGRTVMRGRNGFR